MKQLHTIIGICIICIAITMGGCLESGYEEKQSEPYTFVAQTPRIPAAIVESVPEYTEIWVYTTVTMQYFDDGHVLLNSVSESSEIISPHTEYLWAGDDRSLFSTIEVMFAGTGYTRIYTNEEIAEYTADDTYMYNAEFEVDYPPNMGYVLVYIDAVGVRT